MATSIAFDSTYYLTNNQDVLQYLANTPYELQVFHTAEEHYALYGAGEGRDPNPYFDTSYYFAQNQDVLIAYNRGLISDPLTHFIQYGASEGREPNAAFGADNVGDNFDAETYLAANPDVKAAVDAGILKSAYEHFVLYGQFENRPGVQLEDGRPVPGVGGGDNVGQTFTLTTAAGENVVGTNANDTFNAVSSGTASENTLNIFDSIDGGAGTDTLNLVVNTGGALPTAGTVKNVEIVNISGANNLAGDVDASVLAGVQQIWQVGSAADPAPNDVTNLAANQTAGFRNIAGTANVVAAATAASAAVALDNFAEGGAVIVSSGLAGDGALNSVKVSGTVVDGADAGTTVDPILLAVFAGKDVQTVSIDSAVATTLAVAESGTSTKQITTVDASASTGAISFVGDADVSTIKSGSGNDVLTLSTTTAAVAPGVTAVAASLSSGAGNDTITISTTGTGTTTVDAGAGNDKVTLNSDGSGVLTVNLGAGDDSFAVSGSGAVSAGDVIDGGEGTDTLALRAVGSNNIGSFSNFEVFDAVGLARTLDTDLLAAKNTVTEFVTSGDTGGATLTNLGAGVNFRATGDAGLVNTVTLTQKAAGALTVTLDADKTGTADVAADTASLKVDATNATSLKAVFDTSYLADIAGEATVGDDVSTIDLSGVASTLDVVSGGANASNVLVYTDNAATDALTTVTVSGDRDLDLSITSATKLATVNASALTGDLTFSLADLKDGGSVSLGSGADTITVTNASTVGGIESIVGFEKTAAVAVSTAPADAIAAAAAIEDADVLVLSSASVANANAGVTDGTIANGVLTFTGAGPASLTAAIGIADLAADAAGEAVVFEYLGNSYVFAQGGGTDTVVQLVGVTGVTNFAEVGTSDQFFIV